MDHFRSLMERLIEKPMFINSELQENKLLTDDATIFHLGFEQLGIKQVMDASMMQMRRVFKSRKYVLINPGAWDEESKNILNQETIQDPKYVCEQILNSYTTKI